MRQRGQTIAVVEGWLRIPIRGYEDKEYKDFISAERVTNPYKGL